VKIPSGGNRWAEGRGVKKGRDVKKKIQIRRKKDGVPFATQAAHFEQIKIWKVIDELKGLLCEAPGFFRLSLRVDDTRSEIPLPCYEDERSRLELRVFVFSRDGCLSGWSSPSRWEQLPRTTLAIDGRFDSRLQA